MWTLKRLIDHAQSTHAQINGNWVPARPISEFGLGGLKSRIHCAWLVLSGKADAVIWPENQ